jgi:TetR/AcrR family transcriptional repressor of nem operon
MKKAAEAAPKSRELTKQETREALIVAGISAFSEEGLDTPSLDAICARAGYTRGAFYVHFKDRDDFLVAVMTYIFTGFLDAIIATGDSSLDLERTIETFIAAMEAGAPPMRGPVPMHQFLAACSRSERVRTEYVAVLTEAVKRVTLAASEGQTAGTVRTDVPPLHIALILTALALGVQSLLEVQYPVNLKGPTQDLEKLLRPI